ncbi:tetratricopeptide repeat protein [Streptomyces sp. NPDC052610]|uniref:tetratricopeptide repeat protein n=1 Tax=Streptomyces sp. NPDC052610 TaxID=3154952 RepID=UPI0034362200
MTRPAPGTGDSEGVRDGTFHGPTAIQTGAYSTQQVQFVYQWKPAYRIESFPAGPRPVRSRVPAEQPSRLLRAVHQVVPFTGRHDDLQELSQWRDDLEETLAVRLVHGPGGQGKTRLAAHFAELSRQARWTVWQASVNGADTDPPQTSPAPGTDAGVLLVVDYAERWPIPDLRTLLREPLLSRGSAPVRVLLLARPAGAWWDSLATWVDETLDAPAHAHPLRPLADTPQGRHDLFRQARDRFAHHLSLPVEQARRITAPSALDTDEDYAQILTIHIAALAAVDARLHDDRTPTNPARASAYLLKRERAHWAALHERAVDPLGATPTTMGRTVLTATLTGAIARPHGWTALRRIGLADSTEAANSLLDDHQYCYPPTRRDTVLEPLYPDRLGEDFLGLTIPDPDGSNDPPPGTVTDDWAHQAAQRLLADSDSARWVRNVLTVLIETAGRWPHIATGQLYPLLERNPRLALEAGGTALAALAGLDGVITVLEAIEPHLPPGPHSELDLGVAAVVRRLAHQRLAATQDPVRHARLRDRLAERLSYAGLRDEALTAGREALSAWRELTRTNPSYEPDLAFSLSHLGHYLSEVGQREEALAAAEEAVDIRYRLAKADPAAYEWDVALSLSNLGVSLAEVGRWDNAVIASEGAVEVYRRLARDDPAKYRPDLARLLSNHGVFLSKVGRREEALSAAEEAVEIWRPLAGSRPAAHEPGLGDALTNLGVRLSEAGQRDAAVIAAEEAVGLYRLLARTNPAAHEPGLARSLTNLGDPLSDVGRREEALAAAEEAVEVYRRLAGDNPAAYEQDLASALGNLGTRLSEAGLWEEALTSTREAVGLWHRLADADPARYEPELADALANLGIDLREVGRREESVIVTAVTMQLRRQLADAHPVRFEPDLATSLSELGVELWEMGRQEESMVCITEAVELRRRLADSEPARFEPGLALSLSRLAFCLRDMGRQEEALSVAEEAVAIYRRLSGCDPVTYEPDLALSLSSLGVDLGAAGRVDEALAVAGEAVEIRRRLAGSDPAAHEPGLALALSGLGTDLCEAGRWEEALDTTEEALGIWRRLADADPAAHEASLAKSLWSLAWVRLEADTGLPRALDAVGEALLILRRLATDDPGAFGGDLVGATETWADVLEAMGRTEVSADIRRVLDEHSE